MAGNPSKDYVRQPDPRGTPGDMSNPQSLMNQSWDPVFRTFMTQIVGSPDGVNMYKANVSSTGLKVDNSASMLEVISSLAATATGTVLSQDCSLYQSVNLQLTGTWTGTITFQVSNDNANWSNVSLQTPLNTGSSNLSTTTTANGQWYGNIHARYFRVQITVAGTGTVTAIAEFSAQPASYQTVGVNSPGSQSTNIAQIVGTAATVKASAGQLYKGTIGNSNTSAVYVQFFNALIGSVTLGTTTPFYSIFIPAGGTVPVDGFDIGIAHSTAISIAATTTRTGLTAPTNTVDVNLWYA